MLILSRKVGEKVVIPLPEGGEIVVTYLGNYRGHVRLGFEAPADVVIAREEVLKRPRPEAGAS